MVWITFIHHNYWRQSPPKQHSGVVIEVHKVTFNLYGLGNIIINLLRVQHCCNRLLLMYEWSVIYKAITIILDTILVSLSTQFFLPRITGPLELLSLWVVRACYYPRYRTIHNLIPNKPTYIDKVIYVYSVPLLQIKDINLKLSGDNAYFNKDCMIGIQIW